MAICFSIFDYSQVNVVHNIFLETLVELGVIGLFLYCRYVWKYTKEAFVQRDRYAFGVIFSMIIMSLTTSLYTFKPYFNIMLFIAMTGYAEIKEKNRK